MKKNILKSLFILTCLFISFGCKNNVDELAEPPEKTGIITGQVTINNSKDNNSGITIYIGGTSYSAKTGRKGNFKINNVPEGTDYEIYIEKGSYDTFWQTVTVVADQITDLGIKNITLNDSSDLNNKGSNNFFSDIQIFNINYELNGGTLPEDYPTKYLNGTSVILPIPVKTNYTFGGWCLNSDLSDTPIYTLSKLLKSDVKLYAVWNSSIPLNTNNSAVDFINEINSTKEKHITIKIDERLPDLTNLRNILNQITNKYITVDLSDTEISILPSDLFTGLKNLESVFLPKNLRIINSKAFSNCDFLQFINIPENVTTICDSAFENCTSLTNIKIPDNVTFFGDNVLDGCTSITTIECPYCALGSIKKSNLTDKITNVYIPNTITIIDDSAFSGCTNLTDITIPYTITSIGNSAFNGCTRLKDIIIPNNITFFGDNVLDGCTSITTIECPYCALESIKKSNFTDKITNVYIPNTVTIIQMYEFNGYSSLTSITIPDSVTSIGDGAFYHCTSLTSITIPDSVTSIGNCAFYDCTSLTSITIPDSVTSIGDNTFYNCTSLTTITIPDSVTYIGYNIFKGCPNIQTINVSATLLEEFKDSFKALVKEIIISEETTKIDNYTFSGCTSLTSITIPDSVTSIGDSAFEDCKSLTTITIPNSVTSIGEYAFEDCTSLTTITIPDSVTYIGYNIFRGCTNIQTINVSSTLLEKFKDSFKALVKELIIPNGDSQIYFGELSDYSSVTTITIPDSVTSIGDFAFEGCPNLTEIIYSGTKSDWYAINGIEGAEIPSGTKIICTDGTIIW